MADDGSTGIVDWYIQFQIAGAAFGAAVTGFFVLFGTFEGTSWFVRIGLSLLLFGVSALAGWYLMSRRNQVRNQSRA